MIAARELCSSFRVGTFCRAHPLSAKSAASQTLYLPEGSKGAKQISMCFSDGGMSEKLLSRSARLRFAATIISHARGKVHKRFRMKLRIYSDFFEKALAIFTAF